MSDIMVPFSKVWRNFRRAIHTAPRGPFRRRPAAGAGGLWSLLLVALTPLALQAEPVVSQPAYVTNSFFTSHWSRELAASTEQRIIRAMDAERSGVAGYLVMDLLLVQPGTHRIQVEILDRAGTILTRMDHEPVAVPGNGSLYTSAVAVSGKRFPPGLLRFRVQAGVDGDPPWPIGEFAILAPNTPALPSAEVLEGDQMEVIGKDVTVTSLLAQQPVPPGDAEPGTAAGETGSGVEASESGPGAMASESGPGAMEPEPVAGVPEAENPVARSAAEPALPSEKPAHVSEPNPVDEIAGPSQVYKVFLGFFTQRENAENLKERVAALGLPAGVEGRIKEDRDGYSVTSAPFFYKGEVDLARELLWRELGYRGFARAVNLKPEWAAKKDRFGLLLSGSLPPKKLKQAEKEAADLGYGVLRTPTGGLCLAPLIGRRTAQLVRESLAIRMAGIGTSDWKLVSAGEPGCPKGR
ncbi:MAG: hypothetical protein HQL82_08760 [Magnetococcales bacterium]|nr:hypothetical protein [Magnetococcales bacterium]